MQLAFSEPINSVIFGIATKKIFASTAVDSFNSIKYQPITPLAVAVQYIYI